MASIYKRRIYLIGLVVCFFMSDRISKEIVQQTMTVGQSIPIIKNVFHLTYVHNPGAAFSLFQQYPFALLIGTSILFFGFLSYSLGKKTLAWQEVFGLSMILGGALGNIGDRLLLGQVVDYLDFTLIDYPIFNLADTFIFCGICLLVVYYVFLNRHSHITSSGF